jgi:hypothetical protein
VEILAPDPAQGPPDVVALTGFVGRTAQEGRWRIYLSADLTSWVEFDEGAVVHHQRLEGSPLGGTAVWVRRSAPLTYGSTTTTQVQGDFLQGELTSGFMGQAAMGMAAPDVAETGAACIRLSLKFCTKPIICNVTRPPCTSGCTVPLIC